MEFKYILLIIGLLLLLLSVNMIFSARSFVKKNFPKGDINNATKGMKIFGVLVCIIGLFLTYFSIK